MTSLIGSQTYEADFGVGSLPITDKQGGPSSTSSGGSPDLTGESLLLDGVGDVVRWSSAAQPVSPVSDHSQWFVFKYLDVVAAAANQFISPNPTGRAPNVFWYDQASPGFNLFRIDMGGPGGVAADIALPRAINNTEKIYIGYSYNVTTKLLTAVIKSDDPDDALNVSGSVTETANVEDIGIGLGADSASSMFTNVEFFEYMNIQGTVAPLADLQDTGDELLASPTTVTPLVPRLYPRLYSRLIARDLFTPQ